MNYGRHRLKRSRVLCFSKGEILLVLHENPLTGEWFWLLPGGGREAGETFEQTAIREVKEETGVDIQLVRRVRVPADAADTSYALYLAVPVVHAEAKPTVDIAKEVNLRDARWHPVTENNPLGPLNPLFWGYLEPLIRRLLSATVRTADSPD